MSKHTPGPWVNGGEGRSIGRNEEMTFLFALTQSRVTKKEQLANALLATSAPDLLEASEGLIAWFDWFFGDEPCPTCARETYGECEPGCVTQAVKQAIAKAKGQVSV